MINKEQSIGIEFEILKLVFFIVTYFLITDGLNISGVNNSGLEPSYSSFYNTLFIFSASTWVDYLSAMRIDKRRYYDGKYEVNSYVSIIGSIIGIFTVSISMYCVCEKGADFFNVAVVIYYVSLIFIFLKAFVITDMILYRIGN
jgi:hypothetical protein